MINTLIIILLIIFFLLVVVFAIAAFKFAALDFKKDIKVKNARYKDITS